MLFAFSYLAANLQPVDSRHHDVQQEKLRRTLARQSQSLLSRRAGVDREANRLKMITDKVRDVGVVFQHYDGLFHKKSLSSVS